MFCYWVGKWKPQCQTDTPNTNFYTNIPLTYAWKISLFCLNPVPFLKQNFANLTISEISVIQLGKVKPMPMVQISLYLSPCSGVCFELAWQTRTYWDPLAVTAVFIAVKWLHCYLQSLFKYQTSFIVMTINVGKLPWWGRRAHSIVIKPSHK